MVRESVPLNVSTGVNRITFTGATTHVVPESVVLRDEVGKRVLRILKQNYEADPLSQELLLSRFEGQIIDFIVTAPN